MNKTDVVHARVDGNIKKQAEMIFTKLGLTTSAAISLFLTATINKNGLPLDLSLSNDNEADLQFSRSISTIDGKAPSQEAERIMRLYNHGEIDYETAQFAIKRLYCK